MQTLIDVEIHQAESLTVKGIKYYGIELINGCKHRVYYVRSKEDRDDWTGALLEALGYQDVFEVYHAKETVGQGYYGIV